MIKLNALDPKGSYFKDILTSEEVGYEKPNPKGFKALLARNKLNPKKCIFIGDSEKADLTPAKKLGMIAVHTHEFTKTPSKKFPSLARLDLLENLLKDI